MFRFKGQAQTLSQIITNGTALFWASFTHVWQISLALALITLIPSPLQMSFQHPTVNKTLFVWGMVLALVLLPIKAFLSAMMFHRIFLVGSLSEATFMESARYVVNKIIPLSITFIICNFIIVVGFEAFVFPGFFFAVVLIYVTPLIILDDHSIIEAIQYSWLLVWKSWWRTFCVVIIPISLFILGVSQYFFKSPPLWVILVDIVRMTLVGPLLFAMVLVGFYDAKLRHHVALNLKKPLEGLNREDLSKKLNL